MQATGFAIIKNHPLSNDLINQAYTQWQEFFHSQEKYNYPFNRDTHAGFISSSLSETAKAHQEKDLKEFFHFYPWGPCPTELKTITLQIYQAINNFATELLSWIEASLPTNLQKNLSVPLSNMIKDSPRTLLRIIHYPPLQGNEAQQAIRAAAHEDINLITVLPAATTNGLQVKNKDGQWLNIQTNPDELVINTGDMLAECSQQYYQATTHRVINPERSANVSRLSIPLFLHPCDNIQLSPKHTAKSYCLERFTELGLAPTQ